MSLRLTFISCVAVLGLANPIAVPRKVDSLDKEAFEEAQQRDSTATRVMSDVQIKDSKGKCLTVDRLSGDFRANLTPVKTVECGMADGQGWDFITSGKHNDDPDGRVLIVSTLTQACVNADPRRDPGSQINLFSCGGRADGGGEVTGSQLFATDGTVDSMRFSPQNGQGFCLTVRDEAVDIVECDEGAPDQRFTVGGTADGRAGATETVPAAETPTSTAVTVTAPAEEASPVSATPTEPPSGRPTANPTTPVAVSRAGSTLNPSSAAEAQEFDETATRPLRRVHIRSPDGKCLSVDPTAGDFRQNIIPVGVASCEAGAAGQEFDIVTAGKHNDGKLGGALVVSSLMHGCISFDARRPAGDTVTMFSCGGRADGGGETDSAQLYPFDGSKKITLEPATGNGEVCLTAGSKRLESASCAGGGGGQQFELVEMK